MNSYLIWLEWPEKCFRMTAEALCAFKALVPKGSRVTWARSEAAFLRALPSATHAVVWEFRRAWFARAPKLKVLATPAAGRELVPTEGPKGVKIHFGAFHGAIISETVLGFVLAWEHGFFRKVPLWPRSNLAEHVGALADTTAVVFGYGRIGRAIGARLEQFGVKVHGITRHRPYDLKSQMKHVRSADWLILALPSDTGTDNLLDSKLIAKLSKKCVVINIGRGNSIDETALLTALKAGRIAGAYLDVFKQEPTVLQKVSGKTKIKGVDLATMRNPPENLVRTPHASSFSTRYLQMAFEELKHEGLI